MSPIPELFDRRLKARSLAYLYAAGAILGFATLALPHAETARDTQLVVLGVVTALAAVYLYLRAERVSDRQLHVAVALGTVVVTLANYYVGIPGLLPILYTWVALWAAYFFRLWEALAHVALIGVGYGIIVIDQDHPTSPVVRWLLVVGTSAVAAALTNRLLGRLRGEAARSSARERALRESEARTRLILDSAPDAFIAIDDDGLVIRWNEAAERLLGWPASETIGRPLRELVFPGEEAQAEHDARRMQLEAAEPVSVMQVETDLKRRDGTVIAVDETISRVRIGDEVVTSAFIRDVSERRRRQEEREALLREQAARAEAERVAEIVANMQHLVDATLEHQTLRAILADLVLRIRDVFDAELATIFLADEDTERLVVGASSVGAGGSGPGSVAVGERLVGRVAQAGRQELIQDPGREELHDPELHELGLASLMAAPLQARGRLSGVIKVGSIGRRLTSEDLGLLRFAADRVALAIDHVRLYEREHKIAETLQRSLLPERLPQLPGLVVAARYRPAAAEAEVGGDWFDVIPIPGGRVGLVMGDVAGKGLTAASMVGRLRSALRAYALEGHDPATVVDRLNRLVWTELEESQMATLLYAVVDPAENEVSWVNAGHLPPLLVVGENLPHFLEGDRSVPLGVLPFPSFETNSVQMDPGGTLVLYTDGLVERPGEHLDDGFAALAEVVKAAPGGPDDLCDHILEQLVPEGGAADDVALLGLQNVPITDRFEEQFATEPEALASMRSLLRRWLRNAQGTEQEIAEITTACGEAATNAIEHAGSGGGTPFEVGGRLDGREVAITIRDFGAWRPPREGDQGRGLSLMRALMDAVDVTPSAEGTTVRLSRRLNGEPESHE